MKTKLFSNPLFYTSLFLAGILVLQTFQIVGAQTATWQPPSGNPPGSNVAVPLDTSNLDQRKLGDLGVGASDDSQIKLAYGSDPSLVFSRGGVIGAIILDVDGVLKYWSGGNDAWKSFDSVSLWQSSANDIYYDSGNVGIGTNAPRGLFDVRGVGGSQIYFGSSEALNNLSIQGNVVVGSRAGTADEYVYLDDWIGSQISWTSGDNPADNSNNWPSDDSNYGNIRGNRLSCDLDSKVRNVCTGPFPTDANPYKFDLYASIEVDIGVNPSSCPSAGCYIRPKAAVYGKQVSPGGAVTARSVYLSTDNNLGILKVKYDGSVAGEEGYYAVYAP